MELRLAAAWSRARDLLEASPGGDPLTAADKLIQRSVERDDQDTLRALRRELPDYIEAKTGQPLSDEMERDLDAKTGDPAVRLALARLAEVEAGVPRLKFGLGIAKTEVEGGVVADHLPGWKAADPTTGDRDGELIPIAPDPKKKHLNDWNPNAATDAAAAAERQGRRKPDAVAEGSSVFDAGSVHEPRVLGHRMDGIKATAPNASRVLNDAEGE